MKTSIESVSGVEKRIRVEAPADEVSQRVEAGEAQVRQAEPLRRCRQGEGPSGVTPEPYRGIPVAKEEAVVRDEDVDTAIDLLRESFAQFHAVEGRGGGGADPGG